MRSEWLLRRNQVVLGFMRGIRTSEHVNPSTKQLFTNTGHPNSASVINRSIKLVMLEGTFNKLGRH